MKAYIQAFQGKPWNAECESAYRGFRNLGFETVLFSNTDELIAITQNDIVVGGMLMMNHVFNTYKIHVGTYDYPNELISFLERKISIIKVLDIDGLTLPVFIKPVEEKIAKGIVIDSWDKASDYKNLSEDTEIYCSEVLELKSEWRCFVCVDKLVGVQIYNGNKDFTCDLDTVSRAINAYANNRKRPAAYTLDFGVTADGKTVLIEMNDGFAVGSYGLDDVEYAKFLLARWADLTGFCYECALRLAGPFVKRNQYAILKNKREAYFITDIIEAGRLYMGYDINNETKADIEIRYEDIEYTVNEICKNVVID